MVRPRRAVTGVTSGGGRTDRSGRTSGNATGAKTFRTVAPSAGYELSGLVAVGIVLSGANAR